MLAKTFFRYFPTKEDVVLSDGYDYLIVELIEQSPETLPPAQRIRSAFLEGLDQIYPASRDNLLAVNRLVIATPALRDRLWASQMVTQRLILQALHEPEPDLPTSVAVAACLAAATTAVLTWTENDGTSDLPRLLSGAFDALHALECA